MSASDAEVAIAAAEAGGRIVRERYGAELVRQQKDGRDFATDADIDAELAIRTVLRTGRPGDGFVGEELGSSGGSTRRWLVDPLCGTLNFAAGTPFVVVNVCLYDGARARAAAMVDPLAGETFWTDGSAARLRTGIGETDLVPRPTSSS